MLDAEQADFRGEQLPLHREQRHLIDIARMQLDLDDRLVQDLELDETKIPDGIANSGLLGIMEAFAVLSDAKTRAEYDRALSVPHINRDLNRGGPREVPVRRVHTPQPPLLRVTPVLWERGPWPGTG